LIQGSGAVRAGQWARALCINDSLESGSILSYIMKAQEAGFGVIVFNPNLNRVPKEIKIPSREMLFIPGKPPPPEVQYVTIPEHSSSMEHTLSVWDQVARNAIAKDIVIVAHSAGGGCTMTLLRERTNEILPRLKAIAFTDSFHSNSPRDPPQVAKFMKENAVNWVQSDNPLDTVESSFGCLCLSSGHNKHEYTSSSAINSVFKFLAEKTK